METTVYKVVSDSEWRNALQTGKFEGSRDDRRDGYVHLSTAEQLAGTLARHFAARPDLRLLFVRTADLHECLKWEPSRGGALFPHLYAPLPTSSVYRDEPLPLGPDGLHVLPTDLDR